MSNNAALQSGRQEYNPFGLTPSAQTATEPLLFAKTDQPTVPLSHSTFIGVPLSLLALWTIALLYVKQQTKPQTGLRNQAKPQFYKRVPCRRCIFFKNNPYLKCAIRPVDVLTVNAIDCTDFASSTNDQHKSQG